jgi:hypothetical protein
MPWNSLTSTTDIALMQDLQEQPTQAQAQATADSEEARDNLELTMRFDRQMQSDSPSPTREEREAAVQNMEVGALCWGTPSSQQHAME